MDLESSLLFVNFDVVHFRDLIVFRIPVRLEDPFASEAISGLQIAFIHTGDQQNIHKRIEIGESIECREELRPMAKHLGT